jgi:predicted AAA+ superfamily ATPase
MAERYKRHIEGLLARTLGSLPAVAIDGLKGVGKTESASTIAKTVYMLDRSTDRLLIENKMARLDEDAPPVLIDEWQRLPEVWDFVRRSVDDNRAAGRFLLTGSVTAKNLDVHSGAGRIVRLRMRPLSLEERGLDEPSVKLSDLLGQADPFTIGIEGETSVGFDRYMEEVALSGLPGQRVADEFGRRLLFGSYLDNLLSHDFEQEGIRVRQSDALRRWLASYAAATASTAAYNRILDAATAGDSEKPALKTTIAYREALERLWLIDELSAWLDGENYYSRLKKTPKHYLADTAFVVQLLGISIDALLGRDRGALADIRFDGRYGNIIGRLFESLVCQSLKAYASVLGADVSYFHTENGEREVDFMVTQGLRTVAVEVKLAPTVDDADVRHLAWLKKAMGRRLTDAAVITTGQVAYRRPDGIAVVPAALLGA